MLIRDIIDAKAIALQRTEAGSNKVAYLGRGLFPPKKKAGLDLKWIKTHKGLPVSLAPSTFDSKATLRSRSGFVIAETEMAFFREGYIVSEQDEQEIMRVTEMTDPLYTQVVNSIYDDVNALIDAAEVVPERMIMQLLAPKNGHPEISIAANGATYAYNYDPNNEWAAEHFIELSSANDKWDAVETSDPLSDVQKLQEQIEAATGTRPSIMIVSTKTMGYLRNNSKIKSAILAQNVTAYIFMTDNHVKQLFRDLLGIEIVVYTKMYKDELGVPMKFYPDGMATLLPAGTLGSTWYGVTPEERTGMQDKNADVMVIDGSATICVTTTVDPVQTKTIASEIVLPSFERMDEFGAIKCYEIG